MQRSVIRIGIPGSVNNSHESESHRESEFISTRHHLHYVLPFIVLKGSRAGVTALFLLFFHYRLHSLFCCLHYFFIKWSLFLGFIEKNHRCLSVLSPLFLFSPLFPLFVHIFLFSTHFVISCFLCLFFSLYIFFLICFSVFFCFFF